MLLPQSAQLSTPNMAIISTRTNGSLDTLISISYWYQVTNTQTQGCTAV